MATSTFYKEQALASLKGKWDKGVIAALIYLCVAIVPMVGLQLIKPGLEGLWYIVVVPLAWGYIVYHLGIVRNADLSFERLFDGFKDFGRIFCTLLLVGVYTILWSLLLFIPGIIKAYSYSMTHFILKDEPELKNNAAIEKSMQMMEGRKMRLFLLDLSFIGWALLCLLTLGLGFLLLYPYWMTARVHFYEDLKKEYTGMGAEAVITE